MEFKYLQFPLCLMQEVIKDRKRGLNLCLDYGIGHFALSQRPDINSVARQVVYSYYRDKEPLPRKVIKAIEEAEANDLFTYNDDYACFDVDGKFDNDLNVPEVIRILNDNPEVMKEATEHCQWHGAAQYFKGHINYITRKNTLGGYEAAKTIKEAYEAKFGADAMPSIKPSTLFKFRDEPKTDIDLFLAYVGIKSLIGHRQFISTSKPVILSRMVGAKSKASFDAAAKIKPAGEIIAKYSKRYHMDKLLLSLAEQKFIMFMTKPRISVVYVSTYMEPEALADLVNKSRQKYDLLTRIKKASERI